MAHQAGSAADLERLMEEYGTGLLRLCALHLGDAALAEDAAQETLLRAWRRYGTFREAAAERTWITAIALNVCSEDAPWDDTPLRAVLSLPRKYREVVLLRYYEEFTLEEIADTLGIAPGTVSARLTQAKRKLRPMLEEWYYD